MGADQSSPAPPPQSNDGISERKLSAATREFAAGHGHNPSKFQSTSFSNPPSGPNSTHQNQTSVERVVYYPEHPQLAHEDPTMRKIQELASQVRSIEPNPIHSYEPKQNILEDTQSLEMDIHSRFVEEDLLQKSVQENWLKLADHSEPKSAWQNSNDFILIPDCIPEQIAFGQCVLSNKPSDCTQIFQSFADCSSAFHLKQSGKFSKAKLM